MPLTVSPEIMRKLPLFSGLTYSKTLIAFRLGIKELETFSRTVAKLKDHDITVNGTHVSITNLKCIEEYVCGFCSIAGECPTHQAMEKKTGTVLSSCKMKPLVS
jgi:hypothetical protein